MLSVYAPSGLPTEYFACFLRTPLCSVISGLTKIALFFLLLVSNLMWKATRVPIGCIFPSKPEQELGITNTSFSSSIVMKPNFASGWIAFMAPVMSGCVWVVPVSLCWIVGLSFSPAFCFFCKVQGSPDEAGKFWLLPSVLSASGWSLLHPQVPAGIPPM